MKDRKFEKLFKEEFNKQYNINLTTKDVFQPDDFKSFCFKVIWLKYIFSC